MRITRLVAVFGVGALALSALPGSASAVNSTAGCPQLDVIQVRGSNEPEPAGNLLPPVATAIVDQSQKTAFASSVGYPAAIDTYPQSQALGVANLNDHLVDIAKFCPDTNFVMLGYSQGAHVVADAVIGSATAMTAPLPDDVKARVMAVVLFGDPAHTPNAPYNLGTAPEATGLINRPPDALNSIADRIFSYCDAGDPYCAQGDQPAVHGAYGQVYGADAVARVLKLTG